MKRRRRARSRLTYQQRHHLPHKSFALESREELPLIDAAHVRNAPARLSEMKHFGHVTPSEYRHALRRIKKAAKRYGVRISA